MRFDVGRMRNGKEEVAGFARLAMMSLATETNRRLLEPLRKQHEAQRILWAHTFQDSISTTYADAFRKTNEDIGCLG